MAPARRRPALLLPTTTLLALALAAAAAAAAAAAPPSAPLRPPPPPADPSPFPSLAPPNADGVRQWVGTKTLLSWSPRAFHLAGFLSPAERAHIVALASPRLSPSRVLDPATSAEVPSPDRTSRGAWLETGLTDTLLGIERRLELLLDLPLANQEATQVLAYDGPGAFYRPHSDLFFDNASLALGGQRVATVVMYLTTPEAGGETVFPDAVAKVGDGVEGARRGLPSPPGGQWSDCARAGAAVAAVAGDAAMFYSSTPEGGTDFARHGSCPVVAGSKWVATKWVHVRQYGPDALAALKRRRACVDLDPACPAWARGGECGGGNREWMLEWCRRGCGGEGC